MKFIICTLVHLVAFLPPELDSFTKKADTLLQTYVENGLVNYKGIQQHVEQIHDLYQQIAKMSLTNATDQEKKAFYINAYNLIVIHQIAQNYPVKSPMAIPGFFDQQQHRVAGENLTLNALEKEKLLKPYQDPRIHFALVCAAMSCPPLADFAYQAEQLDAQLDQMTKQALNDPQFIQVKDAQKQVAASKIFEWYNSDFTGNNKSMLDFINLYRKQKIPAGYKVTFYEYDWNLNDVR